MGTTEYWLRGPVDGVTPMLQPVAHALLQARADLTELLQGLTSAQLRARPGSAASIGYHVTHMAGSLDRLLTYARGEALSADQVARLREEASTGGRAAGAASLIALVDEAIDAALAQVRGTREDTLLDERRVGRQALPSNVIGLLFHAAEHATRHAGQAITTAKVLREREDVKA